MIRGNQFNIFFIILRFKSFFKTIGSANIIPVLINTLSFSSGDNIKPLNEWSKLVDMFSPCVPTTKPRPLSGVKSIVSFMYSWLSYGPVYLKCASGSKKTSGGNIRVKNGGRVLGLYSAISSVLY